MPDISNAETRERLATFKITEDEVLLLALLRRLQKDAQHSHFVSLVVDTRGFGIIEEKAFMRSSLAAH